jgi:hypothetical protein
MKDSVHNPLLGRDSELVQRLSDFGIRVGDMLLDKLAGQMLGDPSFRIKECLHPLADVKACAILLRILTKQSWDADDLELVNLCWRQATASELFGDEFEAERFRIKHHVEEARKALAGIDRQPDR